MTSYGLRGETDHHTGLPYRAIKCPKVFRIIWRRCLQNFFPQNKN